MTMARTLLVTVLAALGVFAASSPAWAHTTLTSSTPAAGATLAAAPKQVKLTFAEAVTLPAAPISVTGPNGARWTVGTPSVAGPVVTAPVTAAGPAGRYTLTYKVIAGDGDPISGTVSFTLSAPAAR